MRGDVADVLQVLEAAVADVVRPAGGDGLDRLGRLARDAEVAADAVDRPGPEPDARDPVVEPVDPGVQLVADLEGAVVGQRGEPDLVADRPGGVRRRPARGRRPSWRRPRARPAPSGPTAASKTASVPITLTGAPRSGLARQVGVCKPGEVEQVRRPDISTARCGRPRGRRRRRGTKWTRPLRRRRAGGRSDGCLP